MYYILLRIISIKFFFIFLENLRKRFNINIFIYIYYLKIFIIVYLKYFINIIQFIYSKSYAK